MATPAFYVMDANPAQAYRMPRLNNFLFAYPCCSAIARVVANGLVIVTFFSALLVTGCGDRPEIRQYTVSGKIPDQLLTSDRMLAAIIPRKPDVWFVKVVGPGDAIKLAEGQIREFVTKLSFSEQGPELASLPAGWNRGGEKPMRAATLLIDTPDAQLDVSISNLPISGDWDEQVAMNVNRWRGQLKLKESAEKWAGAESIKVAAAQDHDAIWVDLKGEISGGPSMSSMANATPPFAQTPSQTASPPAKSTTSAPASEQDDDSGLKYDKPETWRLGDKKKMRIAAFNIGPEDSPAELTIIPAGGDLRGNVARWLGQVRGDSPPDDVVDKALASAEKLQVSGRDAQRFILLGTDSESGPTQAIDATIVPMDAGMSLFIKATGPTKTLQQEKDRIGEFLTSIKLP